LFLAFDSDYIRPLLSFITISLNLTLTGVRPKAYTEQGFVDPLDLKSVFNLQPFTAKQIREFVGKWYWSQEYYGCGKTDSPAIRREAELATDDLLMQIFKRDELQRLASNPLLLTIIARFHRRYPSIELPKRRADLYEEICKLQLMDRVEARQLETVLTDEAQIILQMLALEMMLQKEARIDRETLLERFEVYLAAQEEAINATEFLTQVEQISELLVQREVDEFEFSHLSFQEFLAAMEIIRTKQEDILHSHFHEDWWKQVILLYVSKVKKPSGLIRAALNAGAKDLAFACTQETRKQIDEKIKKDLQDLEEQRTLQAVEAEVKTSRYQDLGNYLKEKRWYEADQETYRLMITSVGREIGDYFREDDLKNLPCDELLAINRLWVDYSKQHGFEFGFSVQKQIYVECGGKLDFSYSSNEIWRRFGDRVAWRIEGNWVEYPEFVEFFKNNFMNAKGHLPSEVARGVSRIEYFFSRIETCEM